MTRLRTLALLLVAAHWAVAIGHLYIAANVLPAPDNRVSSTAIFWLTLLHWTALILLWKFSERRIGAISLIFFSAAMTADLYEHFLHPSLNNVFMLLPGDWTAWFQISVYILLALEILGLCLGAWSLGNAIRKSQISKSVGSKLNGRACLLSHA